MAMSLSKVHQSGDNLCEYIGPYCQGRTRRLHSNASRTTWRERRHRMTTCSTRTPVSGTQRHSSHAPRHTPHAICHSHTPHASHSRSPKSEVRTPNTSRHPIRDLLTNYPGPRTTRSQSFCRCSRSPSCPAPGHIRHSRSSYNRRRRTVTMTATTHRQNQRINRRMSRM